MEAGTTNVTQRDLINFYRRVQNESMACNSPRLSAHYAHVLVALRALVESFGPTAEYCESLGQDHPRNPAGRHTVTIDL
ncbi:MAG TPA: hypothetical protein VLY23_03700 [Candidatus Acidoferrum sp.]|nr:hypothetical protein [Candidatus Acidoferrum sp.]